MELLGFFLAPRSPLLGDGDEVDDHQDGHDESRLEAKTAQDGEADQGSLRAPETQVLGRLGLAHESDHRGGDDEIGEQELPVAQVGVDLGKGKGRTEEMERCNGPPCTSFAPGYFCPHLEAAPLSPNSLIPWRAFCFTWVGLCHFM